MEGCCQGVGGWRLRVNGAGRGRGQDVATVITLIFAGQLRRSRMTVIRHRGVLRLLDVGRYHKGAHEDTRQSLPAPTTTSAVYPTQFMPRPGPPGARGPRPR